MNIRALFIFTEKLVQRERFSTTRGGREGGREKRRVSVVVPGKCIHTKLMGLMNSRRITWLV